MLAYWPIHRILWHLKNVVQPVNFILWFSDIFSHRPICLMKLYVETQLVNQLKANLWGWDTWSPSPSGQLYSNPCTLRCPRSPWESQEDGLPVVLGTYSTCMSLPFVVASSERNQGSSLAQAGKFQELGPIPNLTGVDRHFPVPWKVNKWYVCFHLPHCRQDGTVHQVISTWAMPFSQALLILQNSRQTHPLQRRFTKLSCPCRALPSYWTINIWNLGGIRGQPSSHGSRCSVFPNIA